MVGGFRGTQPASGRYTPTDDVLAYLDSLG